MLFEIILAFIKKKKENRKKSPNISGIRVVFLL